MSGLQNVGIPSHAAMQAALKISNLTGKTKWFATSGRRRESADATRDPNRIQMRIGAIDNLAAILQE
jgi:hypothetical protein